MTAPTLREAAQAALDALTESVDLVQNAYDTDWRHGMPTRAAQLAAGKDALHAHRSAIKSLRAALAAQPAPDAGLVASPHIKAMARGVLRQLSEVHPREEIDLDAVGLLCRVVVGGSADGAAPIAQQAADPNAGMGMASCGKPLCSESDHHALCSAAPIAQQAAPAQARQPLTEQAIEAGRHQVFSTGNPYCPCDSKTMRKAVRWAEAQHGITVAQKGE